jgi:uracil-DNA glycosylase family 4
MIEFPRTETANTLADDCRRCPAQVESRESIAWGNGPLDADLVVVGEAPAAGDPDPKRWRGGNRTGMTYTSAHSGRRIRQLLATIGYGSERCYLTNAVKCFPADGDGNNREPTAAERANCRPFLVSEIETVDPDALVATGKHATESVCGLEGISLDGFLETVLDPIPCPALGTTLVPILHPSYRDVWIGRLGYETAEYRSEIASALDELLE